MPKPAAPGRAVPDAWLLRVEAVRRDGPSPPAGHPPPPQALAWDHDHEGVDFARGLFVALAASAVCYGLIFAVLALVIW